MFLVYYSKSFQNDIECDISILRNSKLPKKGDLTYLHQ